MTEYCTRKYTGGGVSSRRFVQKKVEMAFSCGQCKIGARTPTTNSRVYSWCFCSPVGTCIAQRTVVPGNSFRIHKCTYVIMRAFFAFRQKILFITGRTSIGCQ